MVYPEHLPWGPMVATLQTTYFLSIKGRTDTIPPGFHYPPDSLLILERLFLQPVPYTHTHTYTRTHTHIRNYLFRGLSSMV